MSAIAELEQLKQRLESQVLAIQSELDTISKTIRILERETPGSTPQMSLPTAAEGTITSGLKFVRTSMLQKGLSELCREILDDRWLAPAQVRDELMARGYRNTDKGRLLSSVYATLKRLAEKTGELESRKENGRTEFHKRQTVQAA